ncbi:hypothetical protein ACIPLR_15915 [Herbaspirillum huttiense]|uniref:hypothetical protein n=1 Tax=Herbaspirillum huttiense TaxID=863372 RepID=UPI0037F357DC
MTASSTGTPTPPLRKLIPDVISLPSVDLLELHEQIVGAQQALAGLSSLLCRSEDEVEYGAGMMLSYVSTTLAHCDRDLYKLVSEAG